MVFGFRPRSEREILTRCALFSRKPRDWDKMAHTDGSVRVSRTEYIELFPQWPVFVTDVTQKGDMNFL